MHDGCADAFGTSGDEDDFVFEFEVHKCRRKSFVARLVALIPPISLVFSVYAPYEATIRPKKAPRKGFSLMFPI